MAGTGAAPGAYAPVAASGGGPPDPRQAEAVTLLDRYGVDWSRTDLVWSLYVPADASGLWCRSDHRLPAIIAARVEPGPVPAYLLHSGDHLGPLVRDECAASLIDPAATAVLVHGASLRKPTPSTTWRRTASSLPPVARQLGRVFMWVPVCTEHRPGCGGSSRRPRRRPRHAYILTRMSGQVRNRTLRKHIDDTLVNLS